MEYRHPLPAGIAEPDPVAVDIAAMEVLFEMLFRGWPDDQILTAADYQRSIAVSGPDAYVGPNDALLVRGAERAEGFLRAIWDNRQERAHYRTMREGAASSEPGDG